MGWLRSVGNKRDLVFFCHPHRFLTPGTFSGSCWLNSLSKPLLSISPRPPDSRMIHHFLLHNILRCILAVPVPLVFAAHPPTPTLAPSNHVEELTLSNSWCGMSSALNYLSLRNDPFGWMANGTDLLFALSTVILWFAWSRNFNNRVWNKGRMTKKPQAFG